MGIKRRGALIVLEGCDRTGKSTQAKILAEELKKDNVSIQNFAFPNRTTPIGQKINSYLRGIENLSDKDIHILFSKNRKELAPEMNRLLKQGITLIVDRYSFSGVAFSMAKPNMEAKWCWQQEEGLPKPDLVLFLELPLEKAAKRDGYGEEEYENYDFQKKVYQNYKKMINSTWRIINADRDREKVTREMLEQIRTVVQEVEDKPLLKFEKGDFSCF